MAKKKATNKSEETPKTKKKTNKNKFEEGDVANAANVKFDGIISSGSEVFEELLTQHDTISVSPAIDLATGGGIREGTCVALTGLPKSGKTTTSLHFAAKAQKLGKTVVYFNTEGRLTKENFTGIKGLDADKIKIVQSTDKEPNISAEKYLNLIEFFVKNQENFVGIVDSLSNMLPQAELDGEIRANVRNALPRLLAMFFKRISGDIARTNSILICVTHNIANTGGSAFAPKTMADCGNMLQYQAGTNMVITHRGKWTNAADKHIGQIANWTIKTSAAGGIPMSTAASWIRYGIGIDEAREIAEIALDVNMISKAGSWYTLDTLVENKTNPEISKFLTDAGVNIEDDNAVAPMFKFQGMEKLTDFLNENPQFITFIYNEYKSFND